MKLGKGHPDGIGAQQLQGLLISDEDALIFMPLSSSRLRMGLETEKNWPGSQL